jgi:segregation and condensation protein B
VTAERQIVEAILFLAEEPVPAGVIGEVLEKPRSEIEALLRDLASDYETEDRGFILREAAGGWRLYTNPDCSPWLERFVRGQGSSRLSAAALEVLAIAAYRQPVSRGAIAEVRGVHSDGVVRQLLHRGLLVESRDSPGLVSVSAEFLERMGLRSVDELPSLTEFMPSAEAVEDMENKLSPGA